MAAIINLRVARKARARAEAAARAEGNRARFGQTRAEREAARLDRERLTRTIDGARRDPD